MNFLSNFSRRNFLLSLLVLGLMLPLESLAGSVTTRVSGTPNWSRPSTWIRSLTGTATFKNNNTSVTGVGTLFSTELSGGDTLMLQANPGTVRGVVSTVESDTTLTLVAGASGNVSGAYGKQSVPAASDTATIGNASISGNLEVNLDVPGVTVAALAFRADNTNNILTHAGTNTLSVTTNVTINQPSGGANNEWRINAGTGTVSGKVSIGGPATQSNKISKVVLTTGTLTISGDLVFNSPASKPELAIVDMSGGANTLNLAGALTLTNGSGTVTSGASSIFNYNGTAGQTVVVSSAIGYKNLNLNNTSGAGATLGSNTNFNGDIRVQSGTFNNGGFSINAVGGGVKTFEVADGATFKLDGTSGMVTGFDVKTFGASSTVNYSGASQTVGAESYGHFVLSGSGTKTMPAGNVNIAGNFTVTGTATMAPNGGTVTMNGSGAQSISGTTFNNLTINNSGSGVTLLSPDTVSGTLTLTDGFLFSNAPNSITFGTSAPSPIESDTSRIVGTAKMIARAVGTDSIDYLGVKIAAGVDNIGDVSISRVTGDSGIVVVGSDSGIASYWAITVDTQPSTNGRDVTFSWLQGLDNGKDTTATTVFREDSGIWVKIGGATDVSGLNPRKVTRTAVTQFSRWTVSDNSSPLPIQLASYSATVIRDNDVEVSWSTASETNNYGFEVYRRRGESDWIKIAFVEGHGTTLAPQTYSYLDRGLAFGKYYYRIKQIDLEGTPETFPQMVVNVGAGPEKFVLAQNYPNPFNPSTLIDFVVPQSGYTTMKVYNVLGQQVATLFEGNVEGGKIYTARFEASNLPSGLYLYTLRSAGKTETKRMVLMK